MWYKLVTINIVKSMNTSDISKIDRIKWINTTEIRVNKYKDTNYQKLIQ